MRLAAEGGSHIRGRRSWIGQTFLIIVLLLSNIRICNYISAVCFRGGVYPSDATNVHRRDSSPPNDLAKAFERDRFRSGA